MLWTCLLVGAVVVGVIVVAALLTCPGAGSLL